MCEMRGGECQPQIPSSARERLKRRAEQRGERTTYVGREEKAVRPAGRQLQADVRSADSGAEYGERCGSDDEGAEIGPCHPSCGLGLMHADSQRWTRVNNLDTPALLLLSNGSTSIETVLAPRRDPLLAPAQEQIARPEPLHSPPLPGGKVRAFATGEQPVEQLSRRGKPPGSLGQLLELLLHERMDCAARC